MTSLRKIAAAGLIAVSAAAGAGLAATPAAAQDRLFLGVGERGFVIGVEKGHKAHKHYDHGHRHSGHYKGGKGHYGGHKYRDDYRLRPREVRRILRQSGFARIARPEYRPRRDVFVAIAENRRGRDVRVVVDAQSGDILRIRPLR